MLELIKAPLELTKIYLPFPSSCNCTSTYGVSPQYIKLPFSFKENKNKKYFIFTLFQHLVLCIDACFPHPKISFRYFFPPNL